MKSILVPTDFSKCASNAFKYALEIAQATGAGITVLNVVFPNEGVDNNVYNAFWSDEYIAERTKGLKDWVRRIVRKGQFQNVAVKIESTIGFPVASVCEVADQIDADIIVMGTTGATGLRGVFLGSIAAGVLSKTRRPVLSVPIKAEQKKGTDTVFATDFRFKVDERSLAILKEILALKKAKLRIIHIIDKAGEQVDKAREQTLSHKLDGIPHDFHYLHDRDVAQAVSNFVESTDASALVAIAHEHSLLHRLFFDSITRRFAHRLHVPMLTLHDS
jgi:nucleotide-binding universal stress UspA family protein